MKNNWSTSFHFELCSLVANTITPCCFSDPNKTKTNTLIQIAIQYVKFLYDSKQWVRINGWVYVLELGNMKVKKPLMMWMNSLIPEDNKV